MTPKIFNKQPVCEVHVVVVERLWVLSETSQEKLRFIVLHTTLSNLKKLKLLISVYPGHRGSHDLPRSQFQVIYCKHQPDEAFVIRQRLFLLMKGQSHVDQFILV